MFLLQLASLQLLHDTPEGGSIMAVARSNSKDVLLELATGYVNRDAQGIPTTYEDFLSDGTTPCTKIFVKGSPLEYYGPDPEGGEVIIDIGTLPERLTSFIADLTLRVTSDWNSILSNVVAVETSLDVLSLKTVLVPVPAVQDEAEILASRAVEEGL